MALFISFFLIGCEIVLRSITVELSGNGLTVQHLKKLRDACTVNNSKAHSPLSA